MHNGLPFNYTTGWFATSVVYWIWNNWLFSMSNSCAFSCALAIFLHLTSNIRGFEKQRLMIIPCYYCCCFRLRGLQGLAEGYSLVKKMQLAVVAVTVVQPPLIRTVAADFCVPFICSKKSPMHGTWSLHWSQSANCVAWWLAFGFWSDSKLPACLIAMYTFCCM